MALNALTLGLIAALAWGIHDFAVRVASRDHPLMTTLLSVLLIGLFFHMIFMGFGTPLENIDSLNSRAIGLSVVAGLFYLGGAVALYIAFHRGPVKLVAPIIGSYPIASLLFASINGAPSSLAQWLAVFVVVAGVAIVAVTAKGEEAGIAHNQWVTAFVSVIGALGFASTFEVGQMAAAIADEHLTIFITRLSCFAALLVVMIACRMRIRPDRRIVPLMIVMGFMDSLGLLCVLSAGGMADAKFASVAASIFGLMTVLLCWAFLREKMTPPQWAGCLISFAAIGYLAL